MLLNVIHWTFNRCKTSACFIYKKRMDLNWFLMIKMRLTILSKWSQNLKDHLLLVMFNLFTKQPNQLLCDIRRGELLLAWLWSENSQQRCITHSSNWKHNAKWYIGTWLWVWLALSWALTQLCQVPKGDETHLCKRRVLGMNSQEFDQCWDHTHSDQLCLQRI